MTFKIGSDFGPAGRDEWSYSQVVGIGPLRFGMILDDVVEGE